MGSDVFISYTRERDQFGRVQLFRNHLENELRGATGKGNLTVFQDTQDLGGGDNYPIELEDQLKTAKIFLIILSPGWLNSDWCGLEYDKFRQSMTVDPKKTILPLLWYSVAGLKFTGKQQERLTEIHNTYEWVNWIELKYENWDSTTFKSRDW